MNFGQTLAATRVRLGLSQGELAAFLGMSAQNLGRVENGRQRALAASVVACIPGLTKAERLKLASLASTERGEICPHCGANVGPSLRRVLDRRMARPGRKAGS